MPFLLQNPPVVVLGVPFSRVDSTQLLDWMNERIKAECNPAFIASVSVDFAAKASRDAELQRLLLEADVVLCDGKPLLWASKVMNAPLPESLSPSELLPKLCKFAADKKWKIFLLGPNQEILDKARSNLSASYSGLNIVGTRASSHSTHDLDPALLDHLRVAAPDLLLVSFGCPIQEKWIWANCANLRIPLSYGVGNAIAEAAGVFAYSPKWKVKHWLEKMMGSHDTNPMRSLLDLGFFTRAIVRQKFALQQSNPGPDSSSSDNMPHVEILTICWTGRIDANNISSITLPSPTPDSPNVLLDMSQVSFMDSTGLGFLVKLYKSCIAVEGVLVLVAAPPAVKKLLSSVRLDTVIRMAPSFEDAIEFIPGPTGALLPTVDGYDNEYLVWALHGDIRSNNAEEIFQQVSLPWNEREDANELVLDMRHVDFIDSSGVGVLLRLYKLVHDRTGASMTLYEASPVVRNILKLSRLDKVFKFMP